MKSKTNILTALSVTVLALTAAASTVQAQGTFTLGGPYVSSAPAFNCPQGAVCTNFTTSIPGLLPSHNGDGAIAVFMPPAGVPIVQVDLFMPGAGGKFYSANFVAALSTYQSLVNLGHIVVDAKWKSNIWYSAQPGERAGLVELAARPATVIQAIHDLYVKPGMRFAVSGNSAGSAAIVYACAAYGKDQIIDILVPSSGPPFAELACQCMLQCPDSLTAAGEDLVDYGWGFAGGTGPCITHNPSYIPIWEAQSADSVAGGNYYWPNTRVHCIVGSLDRGMWSVSESIYNVLLNNGTSATRVTVPGMGHMIEEYFVGMNQLFTYLTQ